MTEGIPVTENLLLERATRYGLLSVGLYGFATGIASESTMQTILWSSFGVIAGALALSKIPKRLVEYVAKKRGRRYISTFSILLPMGLVLAAIIGAAFPLIVILRGFSPPLDIQIALALEILVILINVGVLIGNGFSRSRQ